MRPFVPPSDYVRPLRTNSSIASLSKVGFLAIRRSVRNPAASFSVLRATSCGPAGSRASIRPGRGPPVSPPPFLVHEVGDWSTLAPAVVPTEFKGTSVPSVDVDTRIRFPQPWVNLPSPGDAPGSGGEPPPAPRSLAYLRSCCFCSCWASSRSMPPIISSRWVK